MNNELGHPFLPFTRFLKALAQPVDVKGNMTNYEKKDNYTDSYFSASECFFAIPAQWVTLLQNYKSSLPLSTSFSRNTLHM